MEKRRWINGKYFIDLVYEKKKNSIKWNENEINTNSIVLDINCIHSYR